MLNVGGTPFRANANIITFQKAAPNHFIFFVRFLLEIVNFQIETKTEEFLK